MMPRLLFTFQSWATKYLCISFQVLHLETIEAPTIPSDSQFKGAAALLLLGSVIVFGGPKSFEMIFSVPSF